MSTRRTSRTEVFDARGAGKPLWSVEGFHSVLFLSNDGRHLAEGYRGGNLFPLDVRPGKPFLSFFLAAGWVGIVTVGNMFPHPEGLPRTASHRAWGSFLGFQGSSTFVMQLHGGQNVAFDANTAQQIMLGELRRTAPDPYGAHRPGKPEGDLTSPTATAKQRRPPLASTLTRRRPDTHPPSRRSGAASIMATLAFQPLAPSDAEGDTLSSMTALLRLDVENLPSSIVWDQPVSDAMLERLCAANDLLQLERTKEGVIRVNPPTAMFTGDGNSEIIYQLRAWWSQHERGRAFDSNTGFYLPDGSMLSPDGAYVSPERLATLKPGYKKGFPHVCPEFVIELLSKSDSLKVTKEKMATWIANGVLLGWLIDPYKRKVLVYVPDAPPLTISASSVKGSGPVEGFTLDLKRVWRCYE